RRLHAPLRRPDLRRSARRRVPDSPRLPGQVPERLEPQADGAGPGPAPALHDAGRPRDLRRVRERRRIFLAAVRARPRRRPGGVPPVPALPQPADLPAAVALLPVRVRGRALLRPRRALRALEEERPADDRGPADGGIPALAGGPPR